MTHAARLLAYFARRKSITDAVARDKLGNARCSDTVLKLRRDHNIRTEMIAVKTRHGKARVARYWYLGEK